MQGLQTKQHHNQIEEKVKNAVANAATPADRQKAIQKIYEDEGVIFDSNNADSYIKDNRSFIRGELQDDGTTIFRRYQDGVATQGDKAYLYDNEYASIEQLRQGHRSLLDWAGSDLSTSSQLMDVSRQLYDARSNYYSSDNIQERVDIAYENGIVEGIHNYNTGRTQRIANMQGFNADYMTEADWQGIVVNKTRQWGSELQSDVMDLVAAPLMLTGFGYAGMRLIGSGAFKVAQGAFRGTMIHGSQKMAASKSLISGLSRVAVGSQMVGTGVNFASNSLTGSNDGLANTYRFVQNVPKNSAHRWVASAEYKGVELKATLWATDMDFALGAKYKGYQDTVQNGVENTSIRLTWNDSYLPSVDTIHELDYAKALYSSPNGKFEVKTGTRAVSNQLDFSPRVAVNAKLKIWKLGDIQFSTGYDSRY